MRNVMLLAGFVLLAACARAGQPEVARAALLPPMQWDHRPEAEEWTRATLAALRGRGAALVESTPRGIRAFCPAYPQATRAERAAFWAGLFSALAKYESTWNPRAVGGGGRWIGLTQIAPRSARYYGCEATTVAELKDGTANLACAVDIAAYQVGRDGVLISEGGRWRGVARDWAPFRNPKMRAAMAAWTGVQGYCRG